MNQLLKKARLYAICDLGYLNFDNALVVSRQLLLGGAGILQLRAKGYDQGDLIDLAKSLKVLCDEFSIPFIVNDHIDLAIKVEAAGLHLGQDDGGLEGARNALGSGVLIGRSTHSLEQARSALKEGADYIGFGPLFPTPTKKGRPAIGLADVRAMELEVGGHIPAFCIGGIKPANLAEVLDAGARRVVVVSHLLVSDHPVHETAQIIQQLI